MAVQISGVLKDGAGKPIQNCTIQLKAKRNSTTVVVNTVASENPDEAGRYSMDVEYGQYSVILLVEGFPPSHAGTITVYEDSKPGTLNDFLGAMTEDDVMPEALRRFEAMVEEAARNAEAASQSAAAAKKSETAAASSRNAAKTSETNAGNSAKAAASSKQPHKTQQQRQNVQRQMPVRQKKPPQTVKRLPAVMQSQPLKMPESPPQKRGRLQQTQQRPGRKRMRLCRQRHELKRRQTAQKPQRK